MANVFGRYCTMGAQLIFFDYWSTERVYKIMEWDLHKQIEDGREKIEKIPGVCLFVHDLRIVFIIIVIIVFISWLSSHDRLRATGGWSCSCSRVNTLYVESIYSGILEYTIKKQQQQQTNCSLDAQGGNWDRREMSLFSIAFDISIYFGFGFGFGIYIG